MMKGCWQMVFQQQKEAKQLLDGVVSSMMEGEKNEGLLIKVFQQQRRTSKQVLDGVVSAMKTVRKWRGWEEMKNAEQWCFSIGKTDERLLVTVFQQREENERLLVFQQREKLLLMVFQQWKGKNETSAGRSCFGNKNDGGMADWNVFGNGKK
jgi:hypothetical protein